jgi:hypothetical protein
MDWPASVAVHIVELSAARIKDSPAIIDVMLRRDVRFNLCSKGDPQ